MKHDLTLVTLTPEQVSRAKEINGKRKRITHALVCGAYGQLFGTEQQCLKYFTVWDPGHRIEVSPGKYQAMFPQLFDKAVKTDKYDIKDYKSTWGLTEKLIEASQAVPGKAKGDSTKTKTRRGVFGWLLSRR